MDANNGCEMERSSTQSISSSGWSNPAPKVLLLKEMQARHIYHKTKSCKRKNLYKERLNIHIQLKYIHYPHVEARCTKWEN